MKQNSLETGFTNAAGASWIPPTTTFASAPQSPATGVVYLFTDALTPGAATGGGNALSTCRWDGSKWVGVSGGGSSATTIQDEGVILTQRTVLNFVGAGVTAADDPSNGRTVITIPGGSTLPAGSSGQVQYNNAGAFGASANLYWDATNSRLGIGTASPSVSLQVTADAYRQLYLTPVDTSRSMRLGYDVNNVGVIEVLWGSGQQPLLLNPRGGNVGIGTAGPQSRLEVYGPAGAPTLSNAAQIATFNCSGGNEQELQIGCLNAAPWSIWLQGSYSGNIGAASAMSLQPAGGNVGIGTTNPLNVFQVHGATDQNLGIRYDGTAMGIGTFNDVGSAGIPMSLNATAYFIYNLSSANPGAGSKQLWYDPADGNRVKYAA